MPHPFPPVVPLWFAPPPAPPAPELPPAPPPATSKTLFLLFDNAANSPFAVAKCVAPPPYPWHPIPPPLYVPADCPATMYTVVSFANVTVPAEYPPFPGFLPPPDAPHASSLYLPAGRVTLFTDPE